MDTSIWPSKSIRAVILAGGRGTRLYPYTAIFPKPLVPLGDVPVLEILLRQLHQQGITDITLTLGYHAELIRAYFGQHHQFAEQINLSYVEEDAPTGTAGSLANVPGLDSTFLVMNGDLLTDLNFAQLIEFHKESKAALTIASFEKRVKVDLGVLKLDGCGQVKDYVEKPEFNYRVSMGVYVYEPQVLRFITPGRYLDFPNLVLHLLARDERVMAFPWNGLWLDIGRPEDYAAAQSLFCDHPEQFGFRQSKLVKTGAA